MWHMKRSCLVIFLFLQFVTGIAGQEEGSGMGENSDIINNVRGDGIVPGASDYDYSQFIPLHNDFNDDDGFSDNTSDGDDDLCDHPNCWTTCQGSAEAENNMVCSCCPAKRPVKMSDIDLSVSCSPSGAVVGYNLTNVMEFELDDMEVVLSYQIVGEENKLGSHEVADFSDTEFSWLGLCSGTDYQFCVDVTHSNMSTLDKPMCQPCTPQGPPASNPSSVSVSGGLTYLEASWEHVLPQCDDLIYQVLLNDEPPLPLTDKNYKRISYLTAGVYNVSVRAENRDGHNSQPMPSFLYTIQELTPPMDVAVIHTVINGSLLAELSWNNSFNFEETSLTRRGYILNLYNVGEEDVPVHTENFTWDEMEKTLTFDYFPHWNAKFSLQTFFGDHKSNETDLVELFSDAIELSPPVNVTVRNVVINDTLAAVIDWDTSMDIDGFEGLEMSITLRSKDGAILSTLNIPHTQSTTTFTLSDDIPMDTMITLKTLAGDAMGLETEPIGLFSGLELTAPRKISVTHTVENDNLTVLVEWENSLTVDGYSADQEVSVHGMGTVVKMWDDEDNLLRSVEVPLSDNFTDFTLDGDLPWNTRFTLQTFAIESEGDKTEAENLFSGISLTSPIDISIEYLVVDDILTAEISWAHSVQDVFAGLGTAIDLWEGDTIISTTQLDHTENKFRCALGTQVSWNSMFSLRTTALQTNGDQTDIRQVFGGFLLSPPKDISVKHSYKDGELIAIVNWENSIDEKFAGLQTVLNLMIEDERIKRSEMAIMDDKKTWIISYEDTEANFSSANLPWNTKFTLQSAVGDDRGKESDTMDLFNDIHLDPPGDIDVTPEVVDDTLTAVVSWNNPNVFDDMSGPPVKIRLWDETEEGETNLIEEKTIPNDQNQLRIILDDGITWQTKFSLLADFGVKQGLESEYIDLFNQIHLTPPNITIIANDSSSLVEWNHTLELGQFQGLGTIIKIWTVDQTSGNLTLLSQNYTDDTSAEFSVGADLPHDASITLQSYVGYYHSNQTELAGLFMPVALKQSQLNRILLIVGLTLLLIIYILATAYCLRMVKKKGTYKLKEKHETFSPGKFSESDHLLPPGTVKPKLLSEDGSCATEQSQLSENSLNNLVPTTPYLGESMITLNKFNDDDDFMGNFDEDGSFIGDYDEHNEEQAQAIQNKLLVFQQMYRANGALCT